LLRKALQAGGKGIAAASAGVYSVSAKSGFTGLPAKFFAPLRK